MFLRQLLKHYLFNSRFNFYSRFKLANSKSEFRFKNDLILIMFIKLYTCNKWLITTLLFLKNDQIMIFLYHTSFLSIILLLWQILHKDHTHNLSGMGHGDNCAHIVIIQQNFKSTLLSYLDKRACRAMIVLFFFKKNFF